MTERKAPDSGGEIPDEIFTFVKNEMAQHEELFSMLSGSRKWHGGRVAAGLRSEQLSPSLRLFALSCLANLIDGKDGTETRRLLQSTWRLVAVSHYRIGAAGANACLPFLPVALDGAGYGAALLWGWPLQ